MSPLQQNDATAYLIIEQNRRWSDVYRLIQGRPTIIGRSSECQIAILDDRSSRQHARIDWTDGGWVLTDLSSRNGTKIDEHSISGTHLLADGQRIQIGGSVLRFTHNLSVALPAPTETGKLAQSQAVPAQATSDMTGELTNGTEAEPLIVESGEPRRWLVELSIEMVGCATIEEAADLALQKLLYRSKVQAGAILMLDGQLIRQVLAASERPGKAYRRLSDRLVELSVTDNRSILARNIQTDGDFVDHSSSLQLGTASVICVPVLDAQQVIGLVHLYSRHDEPELTNFAMNDAAAVAEALTAVLSHFKQRGKLEKKLLVSRRQVHSLRRELNQLAGSDTMVGKSATMMQLQSQLTRVASTDATVLLRGESGVGKELAARHVHMQSKRKNKAFVAVNCAALTSSLLESELFGHEKGAFTGATEQKQGKFEMANGGTLMLDEVGEMSMETQTKFLRVLEGHPFERVGGSKPISVDVRIVAATNRDLEQAVKDHEFRADLYFRLRVVEIRVPPLRQRREDIVPLAENFLANFLAKDGTGPRGFSQRAKNAMQDYDWPGNIRELKNAVERAFVLSNYELAEPEDLALSNLAGSPQSDSALVSSSGPIALADSHYREFTLAELEQLHIEATLRFTNGQKSRAATILGIERSTLDRKLKRFDQDAND